MIASLKLGGPSGYLAPYGKNVFIKLAIILKDMAIAISFMISGNDYFGITIFIFSEKNIKTMMM